MHLTTANNRPVAKLAAIHSALKLLSVQLILVAVLFVAPASTWGETAIADGGTEIISNTAVVQGNDNTPGICRIGLVCV